VNERRNDPSVDGADPREELAHRAVPQDVQVIDAVRASGHPRDQAAHLQVRVHPARAAGAEVLTDQVSQPGLLRQG
jgi:hypothetical protein